MRRAALILAFVLGACGQLKKLAGAGDEDGTASESAQAVTPPFPVADECAGLLLVWFDADGFHTASKRSDVPEAHRQQVRVDSLAVAPEQRLDADLVYVADLRSAPYRVTKMPRVAFEALADAMRPKVAAAPTPAPLDPSTNQQGVAPDPSTAVDPNAPHVILYMASWCGVCHQAAEFMRARGIPFVSKDIERDPAALAEMQQKARDAGLRPTGVPVIDVRGHLMLGFDGQALLQYWDPTAKTI